MALQNATFLEIYNDFNSDTVGEDDIFLFRNNINGQVTGILAKDLIPNIADITSFIFASATDYAIDDIVVYAGKWWISLQTPNIGNFPTEGAFWTQINKLSPGLQAWSPGLIVEEDFFVEFGGGLYKLNPSPGTPRPYVSIDNPVTDAGNWTSIGGGAVPVSEYVAANAVNSVTFANNYALIHFVSRNGSEVPNLSYNHAPGSNIVTFTGSPNVEIGELIHIIGIPS